MPELTAADYEKIAATLYANLGKAVWTIQHLEDALSHSIAIKNPEITTRKKGDEILNSNRKLTLGQAVKLAKKENTYSDSLQKRLQDFLTERNWLVHKCMRESVNEMGLVKVPDELFEQIKTVQITALSLKEAIEIDMLEFAKANGRGDIVEKVRKAYIEWVKTNI